MSGCMEGERVALRRGSSLFGGVFGGVYRAEQGVSILPHPYLHVL